MTGTPGRRVRLTTAALITISALLVVPGVPFSAHAGSLSNPEIEDPVDDVNPAAFAINDSAHAPLFSSLNLTAYDVRAAYWFREGPDDIFLRILVKDLPDAWGPPLSLVEDENPFGPNVSQPFVQLHAFFQVNGASYQVNASLAFIDDLVVVDRYQMLVGGAWVGLEGTYNTTENSVTVRVPKPLIGDPNPGQWLDHFRVEGRFADLQLDFAPNAVNAPVVAQPNTQAILRIVLNLVNGNTQIVQPTYGDPYRFGQYGDAAGLIQLTSSHSNKNVAPGGTVGYAITIRNDGYDDQTVLLTLPAAGSGWSHRLDLNEILVAARSSETFMLRVTAPQEVGSALESRLSAAGEDGARAVVVVRTRVTSDGGGNPPSDDPPIDTTGLRSNPAEQGSGAAPKKHRRPVIGQSPGLELVPILLAMAALTWVASRRR